MRTASPNADDRRLRHNTLAPLDRDWRGGTLAQTLRNGDVPERADVVGLLSNLPSRLARLEASGFYLSARLRESVLARHRIRHGIGS